MQPLQPPALPHLQLPEQRLHRLQQPQCQQRHQQHLQELVAAVVEAPLREARRRRLFHRHRREPQLRAHGNWCMHAKVHA